MKTLLAICAILFAPAAFAGPIDYSVLADAHHPGFHKMHRCLKQAWKAAEPTDEQKENAKRNMDEAKAVMEQHKDAIKTAMESMKTAWGKYPIVQAEVVAAEDALREHTMPVKAAFRDAGINTLNLLSAEQRTKFDDSFKACMD